MISHGEPIEHDDIFGKRMGNDRVSSVLVLVGRSASSLKMFGPVGYSIFDDPPVFVRLLVLCAPPSADRPDRRNANWANQHLGPCHRGTGICKGALHNNTVETELNLAAEKAENKEGDRHGRRGFGGSAGLFCCCCCCCGGQKRAKDIGKALFCQLLCQGQEE